MIKQKRRLTSAEVVKRKGAMWRLGRHSLIPWRLCSPHCARALLLASRLHFVVEFFGGVEGSFFAETLAERRKAVVRPFCVCIEPTCIYADVCAVASYLRELGDDAVSPNRRKNAQGWDAK